MIDWIITPQTKLYQSQAKKLRVLSSLMRYNVSVDRLNRTLLNLAKSIIQASTLFKNFAPGGYINKCTGGEWEYPNWMNNTSAEKSIKHLNTIRLSYIQKNDTKNIKK